MRSQGGIAKDRGHAGADTARGLIWVQIDDEGRARVGVEDFPDSQDIQPVHLVRDRINSAAVPAVSASAAVVPDRRQCVLGLGVQQEEVVVAASIKNNIDIWAWDIECECVVKSTKSRVEVR